MNVQSILGSKGSDVVTVTSSSSLADAVRILRDAGVGIDITTMLEGGN